MNKPYRVLCQFSGENGRATLADFVPVANVYPAGRLDADSEGLLLLTDDGKLQQRIASPRHELEKRYRVQVEGQANDEQLEQLQGGIVLDGRQTAACTAAVLDSAFEPWSRDPPIRERRAIPTCWLELTLREGRNRQVRRMTAAVGLPTLRLIRVSIGKLNLLDASGVATIAPGSYRDVQPDEVF